ncbi:MAG: MCP four helix bundle domain-containing protein, partial [Giesbergeria sp.]
MTSGTMTIRGKLALAFGGLAILVLIVTGLSLRSLGAADERLKNFVEGVNARALAAAGVRTAVDRRAIAARDIVFATSPADIEALKAQAGAANEDVQKNLATLHQLIANARDLPANVRNMVDEIDKVEARYQPVALN